MNEMDAIPANTIIVHFDMEAYPCPGDDTHVSMHAQYSIHDSLGTVLCAHEQLNFAGAVLHPFRSYPRVE